MVRFLFLLWSLVGVVVDVFLFFLGLFWLDAVGGSCGFLLRFLVFGVFGFSPPPPK